MKFCKGYMRFALTYLKNKYINPLIYIYYPYCKRVTKADICCDVMLLVLDRTYLLNPIFTM